MTRKQYKAMECHWSLMDAGLRFKTDYELQTEALSLVGQVRRLWGKCETLTTLWKCYRMGTKHDN